MPLRINLITEAVTPLPVIKAQAATCDGLARIQKQAPHGGSVAIVGGGESTQARLDELRAFKGEIWAINSTAKWLMDRGVDCTFLAIDPGPVEPLTPWGKKALLATSCHPDLRQHFDEVRLFDLIETHDDGIAGGATCASRAMSLAIHQGYFDVHIYGCEGSFQPGKDHVDRHEDWPEQVIIQSRGVQYLTVLAWMHQSECMSGLIRLAPMIYKNHSGGLLQAMVDDPDGWEVVAVSEVLRDAMLKLNKETVFTEPFDPCL